MRIGLFSPAANNPNATLDDMVEEARAAERQGFAFLGVPQILSIDAMTALSVVGRETRQIELVTTVVPTPMRHPMVMAQQALTVQLACDGRFSLGIGLSHKIMIEGMLGLSYARPAAQMEEYLQVLEPLLRGESVAFEGEFQCMKGGLGLSHAKPVPVLVAALGPRMLAVTGRLADGTITWMTGPRTLADFTIPTIRKAAAEAGRPEPRVVAALPCALTGDTKGAREVASKIFRIYGTLPSYRAMLDREGAAGPADVVIAGDETTLRAALRQLAESGVTDFAAITFPADEGAAARTQEFLASVSVES